MEAIRELLPEGDHASVGTVCGVPLEPGERVIYFVAPRYTAKRTWLIAAGVVFTVVALGLLLIVYGALYEKWALRFVALTNRRIIVRKGEREPRSLRLDDVVDLRARREEAAAAGPLAQAGATLRTRRANARAEKMDARYWTMTEAIVVQGKRGTLAIDKSAEPERLGPAIAHALYTEGYVDRSPTADCPP